MNGWRLFSCLSLRVNDFLRRGKMGILEEVIA